MNLNKNMGTLDRIVRLVLAVAVAVLYFTGNLSGLAAIILGILAIIFVVTSLVGFCPLYVPFKVSTRKQ
jgi:small-conductance mechanosensitive channel